MSQPWTTPAQVVGRWVGANKPTADDPLLPILIADAENVILSEIDVQARLDAAPPTLKLAVLQQVTSYMVMRQVKNPDNLRTRMDVTGPFTLQEAFGGDMPGTPFLTDDERRLLGYGPLMPRRAFTVDPTPQSAYDEAGRVRDELVWTPLGWV